MLKNIHKRGILKVVLSLGLDLHSIKQLIEYIFVCVITALFYNLQ